MLFKSIRARMTAAFSLSIAVLMLLVCMGLIWYAIRSAKLSTDALLMNAARNARAELMDNEEPVTPANLIDDERDELSQNGLVMLILDKHGHVVGKTQRESFPWPPVRHDGWRTIQIKAGTDKIVVGTYWEKTETALRYHAIVLLSLSLFVVLLAAVGAWILVGRTLSPIAALSRQANTASTDSLNISLTEPSQDAEIVELVATLNGLLKRLTEATAAKGRFYSAASHELRTPLQALSGHLELALTRKRSNEEYKKAIEEAYKQARRLISLVKDLLMFYQLDSATTLPPKEPENLSSVCKRILSQLQPLIKQRGLQVNTNLPAVADIQAPPTHIDMLVRNLLENAVKYASPNGLIQIDLNILPDSRELIIFNECIPIPEWNTAHLFEPLTRLDSSRNNSTGGSGLGLAISKAIAVANGWQLSIKQESDGVTARVIIPVTTPEMPVE